MFSILRWPCLWSISQRIHAGQLPLFQLLSGTQLVVLCELHKGISALCLSFGFESERRAVCLGEGKLITYYTLLTVGADLSNRPPRGEHCQPGERQGPVSLVRWVERGGVALRPLFSFHRFKQVYPSQGSFESVRSIFLLAISGLSCAGRLLTFFVDFLCSLGKVISTTTNRRPESSEVKGYERCLPYPLGFMYPARVFSTGRISGTVRVGSSTEKLHRLGRSSGEKLYRSCTALAGLGRLGRFCGSVESVTYGFDY